MFQIPPFAWQSSPVQTEISRDEAAEGVRGPTKEHIMSDPNMDAVATQALLVSSFQHSQT